VLGHPGVHAAIRPVQAHVTIVHQIIMQRRTNTTSESTSTTASATSREAATSSVAMSMQWWRRLQRTCSARSPRSTVGRSATRTSLKPWALPKEIESRV
jgi:hypothetical protein